MQLSAFSLPNGITEPVTCDGHVHTYLCRHAVGTMEEYVRAAVLKGLQTITFLEHMEAGIQYPFCTWLKKADFDLYWEEGKRLQKAYHSIIAVKLGVELGYNPNASSALEEALIFFPWDIIGLSCHFYPHEGRHYNMLSQKGESIEKLAGIGSEKVLSWYLDALKEGVERLNCTVLCHLDAALRHLPGVDYQEKHAEKVMALLQAVHKKGMALEINTSGYHYRGHPFPADWIILKAVEMGIRLAPGSDAHRPEDVGRYFSELPAYLQALSAQ